MPSVLPTSPLQSAILEIVAKAVHIRINDLYGCLRDEYKFEVSQVTLYRAVAALIDAQVLLRFRRRISLNLVWIHWAIGFFDGMKKIYALNVPEIIRVPLREGGSQEYHADSLYELDPLWSDLHLEIAIRYRQFTWYGFNSHPYHYLGMPDTERRLHEALVANGVRYHLLFGSDTFLDRYGVKLGAVEGYQTAFGSCPCLRPEGHALWTTGHYTIEVIFPDEIAARFAVFFERVKRERDFERDEFAAIFKIKARCMLRVRRSRREAARWLQVLRPYFDEGRKDLRNTQVG